jgi:phosphoribosyl 1,2-cyclic phosphodiesterase
MPHLVEKDGTTVIEVLGEKTSRREDKKVFPDTRARVLKKGDIVDFDILPAQLERKTNNLKQISEEEAKKLRKKEEKPISQVRPVKTEPKKEKLRISVDGTTKSRKSSE